mmetsp:Transcript_18817/g.42083  ORF Transcript_18817/g.42083 Transcript_18817/m.42083 type:complete len:623 (+) Transcript_18817:79-1947(+)
MGCLGRLCNCLRSRGNHCSSLDGKAIEDVYAANEATEDEHTSGFLDQCTLCVDMMNEECALELAEEWMQLGARQIVAEEKDATLYVGTLRATRALTLAACVGMQSSSSQFSVTALYSNLVAWLHSAWTFAMDPMRQRLYLRLQCGCLLHAKVLAELCFPTAFAQPAYSAELTELAVSVFSAIERRDVDVLWNAVQLLASHRRGGLLGSQQRRRVLSEVVSVMLLIQATVALLVDERMPVQAKGSSTSMVLSGVRREVAELVGRAPPSVAWLASWQLLISADRLFRLCHRIGSLDILQMRHWAVKVAGELAIWRIGDPHSCLLAIRAVQTLVLWRDLLQDESLAPMKDCDGVKLKVSQDIPALVHEIDEALSAASVHCSDAEELDSHRSCEVRCVSMLLTDNHLATLAELASQKPCLLHVPSREPKTQAPPKDITIGSVVPPLGPLFTPLRLRLSQPCSKRSGLHRPEVASAFELLTKLEGTLKTQEKPPAAKEDLDVSAVELLEQLADEWEIVNEEAEDGFDLEAQELPSYEFVASVAEKPSMVEFVEDDAPLGTVVEDAQDESQPEALRDEDRNALVEALPVAMATPVAPRRKPGQVNSLVKFFETSGGQEMDAAGASDWL